MQGYGQPGGYPQPQPSYSAPSSSQPTYGASLPPPPPPQQQQQTQQPLTPTPEKKSGKLPIIFISLGVVLLIVGNVLMVLLWPFVAVPAMGIYDDPDDLPDTAEEGKTYSLKGQVIKAKQKWDYTVMVIKFKDEKMGYIEKGRFNEGETVIFNIKCTNKDKWEYAQKSGDGNGVEETDWDVWFDTIKEMDESQLETAHDMFKSMMDATGMEVEVVKTPLPGGIAGIVLLVVGVVFMILGIVFRLKRKTAAVTTSQQWQQPQQQPQPLQETSPQPPPPPPSQPQYPPQYPQYPPYGGY